MAETETAEPIATEPEPPVEIEVSDEVRTLDFAEEPLLTLAVEERRIGLRIVPYNVVAEHPIYGSLLFEPGAFGKVDPRGVRLRMDHADPPTGLGLSYEDRPDGAHMDFRVSRTARGDEQLTLARDGISRGASVGYREVLGRPRDEKRNGRLVRVYPPESVLLDEVSTTWRPTFQKAGVSYVLHSEEKGTGPMTEAQTEAPAIVPGIDYDGLTSAVVAGINAARVSDDRDEKIDKILSSFEDFIELQRANFTVPGAQPDRPKPKLHHWVEYSLRKRYGDAMTATELKTLALDDVVTTEQPGLVPSAFSPDYDDLINQDRPFLSSTRKIEPPQTGTTMTLPIITTRAVAGTQAGNAEKGALTTTATKVGTGTFAYKAVFGGADISIQFINRAERGFFELLTGDMAMAYALDCEDKALDALIAGYTDSASGTHEPYNGGTLDPENLLLGNAYKRSIASFKRGPDTIWLNSTAVAAFIDAKAPLTNAPLYSNLAASFTAGGGAGGTLSGLRPIYVPAMDDESFDVIVGPSRGFVWAEDPSTELRADVPEKGGRDIVLAGGIFPAPRFADAFTYFSILGS